MDLQITQENMTSIKKFALDVKRFIVENTLYVDIKGKNYVYVEGWQFMGGMMGIEAVPTEIVNNSSEKETKYTCTVELFRGDAMVGRGYAVCSNLENKKKDFDEYAIASMAQTRAVGKAYRLRIGWLMKLAGYEGVPAEEMGMEEMVKATPDKKQAIIDAAKEKDGSNDTRNNAE